MTWIQTRSGKAVDLLAPKSDTIDFGDIAYALARICRFTGHTSQHYSVAQHSIRVALLLPPSLRLRGLLHDAPEYVTGDNSTPLKMALSPAARAELKAIDYNLHCAIMAAVGMRPTNELENGAIKYADVQMLETERRALLGPSPRSWGIYESVPPVDISVAAWSRQLAEKRFLELFYEYAPHMTGPQALAA